MKDSQFSKLVKIGIAASGKPKMHFWRLAGLNYPSDFSAMLGGYKRWPEDVKKLLIDELGLRPLIEWQEKRLEQLDSEYTELENLNELGFLFKDGKN